jgi:flagellar basal-body rod modification protein FlgD
LTTINSINSYSSQSNSTQPTKELGKEAFLKILVTQLQNQDATQPMQDGEFISQMSQLSVMEQLSNLNQNFTAYLQSNNNLSQYSTMLDKKVTWTNPETNGQESGVVTGVQYKDNFVYFKVGDQEILSTSIQAVEVNN